MKSAITGVLLTLSAFLLAGCERPVPTPSSPQDTPPLAVVDGRPVTAEHLAAEIERLSQGGRAPDPKQVLDELVDRERLVARALRLDLDQDPEVRRAYQSVLIARLKERELQPRLLALEMTPHGSDKASTPENSRRDASQQARLALLRLELPNSASSARIESAKARMEKARAAASLLPAGTVGFGTLAAEYSDDPNTRLRGGDLGWLATDPSRYHLDPAALEAGFSLQSPGDISPVIRGRDALYLVRLIERRALPPSEQGFSAEVARHRDYLDRRKSVEQGFLIETRRLIPTEVNQSAVEDFMARQPTTVVSSPPRL